MRDQERVLVPESPTQMGFLSEIFLEGRAEDYFIYPPGRLK